MKNKINLPPFNWGRLLWIGFVALFALMAVALITRSQTIIRLVQILDVAMILFFIGFVTIALIKRYKNEN